MTTELQTAVPAIPSVGAAAAADLGRGDAAPGGTSAAAGAAAPAADRPRGAAGVPAAATTPAAATPAAATLAAAAASPAPRALSADQRTAPYLDALRSYAALDPTRLNVPSHQAGAGVAPLLRDALGLAPFALDLPPLLWGVDRGASPTPLERAERLAAEAWGARRTWFLTNGASQGNQTTCLALRSLGEQIVVQRSVHSSVVDGAVLADLRPRFVLPQIDRELGVAHGVTPAALAAALREAGSGVAAAYIVSPSYFGAVADVAGCAAVAHAAGVPLVVDEAWGAHFGFHPGLPASALQQGADVVVSSTHKLAGSLTQSAMLHLGEGPWADRLEGPLDRCRRSVESTSASSLLMASLDGARHRLATAARPLFDETLATVARLREGIDAIDGVAVANDSFLRYEDVVAVDPLRLVIDVRGTGLDGHEVGARLRQDDAVDLEVLSGAAVVAVLGPGEPFARCAGLLRGLARLPVAPAGGAGSPAWAFEVPPPGEPVLAPRAAFFAATELVAIDAAAGRVSADSLAAYPPGIPNLLPGERISAETIAFLRECVAHGGWVRGAPTAGLSHLRVVA